MASKKPCVGWTPRERDLAELLYRSPRTSQQILSSSNGWNLPFPNLKRTQQRLRDLVRKGWIARRRYRRSIGNGNQYYYQLTLAGFREWREDPTAKPPTKRYFSEIAELHHHHTYELSIFWTFTEYFCHQSGLKIENVFPEGAFSLSDGTRLMKHDGYLELVNSVGRRFPTFLELDRSTEPLTSKGSDVRKWQDINLVYDAVRNLLPRECGFRTLVVCSRSRQRAKNIVDLFGMQTSNPNRQLVMSVFLGDFTASSNGLLDAICFDHRRSGIPFLPEGASKLPPRTDVRLLEMLSATA